LGRAQLTRLDEMIQRRRIWRNRYREFFAAIPGIEIFGGDDTEDNCWLTSVIVDPGAASVSSDELQGALQEANIESRPLWKPMHLQPVFEGSPGKITGASQQQFETGLTLPRGSKTTDNQFGRVMELMNAILSS